jgi:hypothetical protein
VQLDDFVDRSYDPLHEERDKTRDEAEPRSDLYDDVIPAGAMDARLLYFSRFTPGYVPFSAFLRAAGLA